MKPLWRFCFISCLLAVWGLFVADAVAQQELPDAAYVTGVVGHGQQYNLSCESRSAADWATFFGTSIDESTFFFSLPRSDNPDIGFVGEPNDPWGYTPPFSYGVHAAPVATLLREHGLPAIARRGLEWDDLRAEIAAGRPAIVWLIGRVWAGTPVAYTAVDGQTATVAAYEHTMILVGYDPTSVTLVNASTGREETHALAAFFDSWAVLGNMAILAGSYEPGDRLDNDNRYIVGEGDSLLAIAAHFGVSWHELAIFNQLHPQDIIHVGQELTIPVWISGSISPSLVPPTAGITTTVATTKTGASPTPTVIDSVNTYTVQRGDHLLQIARTVGVSWQSIADLNQLAPPQYVVYPGQHLQLPGSGAVAEPATAATSYLVQPGDTLHKIALRFGRTWPELAQANGIGYPYTIVAGQSLTIP